VIKTGTFAKCVALATLAFVSVASPVSASKMRTVAADQPQSTGRSTSVSGATDSCLKPNLNWDGTHATSVAGPFFLPKDHVNRVSSPGNTAAVVSSCNWKLSFTVGKHDPTVWVYSGTPIPLQVGVINEFNDGGTDGVKCAAYYQLGNGYGGAVAESALASTDCNTDGFVNGESSVTAYNANLQAGPATVVAPTQSWWYGSYVGGANVLGGAFTFCSQDPLGQHSTYACIQFQAGPYD
jgi:hypothetical protein